MSALGWKAFVLEAGVGVPASTLAHITGQSETAIRVLRETHLPTRRRAKGAVLGFDELFAQFHGHPPQEADWPVPLRAGRGAYEWQTPEVVLLGSLVGQMSTQDIATLLTQRLRERTGDVRATRTLNAVQCRINQIGLHSSDVLGGIRASEAGDEIGSYPTVIHAIRSGQITPRRVGRQWVISRPMWEAWKAARVLPPAGYVPLASIREALGIQSDSKLPEFAAAGHIPTAIRCTPLNPVQASTTRNGTWFIDAEVAKKLVADRHAGLPMPWHGQPNAHNLRVTYRLWTTRQHPSSCATCAQIWGTAGAPTTFDDYVQRYPPLAHGAKRHLTLRWTPGLTLAALAREAGIPRASVQRAITQGQLQPTLHDGTPHVSRSDATRWIERGCPTGDNERSWLAFDTACARHDFTREELLRLIAEGVLPTKQITNGPKRGDTFVSRHACAAWREQQGYTEAEAARRAGITVPRLRALLEGVDWRGTGRIPLVTVQAVIKRLESREGVTLQEAAATVGQSLDWVEAQIRAGVVRVSRAPWDQRRRYLTQPMLERLRRAPLKPVRKPGPTAQWLLLSTAATLAGVTNTTLTKWAERGEIETQPTPRGTVYCRRQVKASARRYWKTCRFHRATPPAWLSPTLTPDARR